MVDSEVIQGKDTIAPIRQINPHIDGNETPASLMKKLNEYCTGLSRVTETGHHLMFWIATVAVMIRDTEAFTKHYTFFTDFVQAEIIEKHRISHGSIWSWIGFVSAIPGLNGTQAKKLGNDRLMVVKRVIKKVGMTPTEIGRMIKLAEDMSPDEILEKYPEAGDGRSGGYRVLRIPKISRKIAVAFPKWIGDRNPDKVLQWLMDKHPELPEL